MKSGDDCPGCGEDVILVDPAEAVWQLDADEYDEDTAVWLCTGCGWHEEATEDESLDEATANLEWILARLEGP